MTAYTWKSGSGDWNLAANWSPAGGPPKSTDTATINGTAATTITVDTADVANSLTLSDANATLNDDGASASLTIGGTLTMSNGTLNLSPNGGGGVLTVGALNLSGGALTVGSSGQLKLNGTLSQTGGTLTLNGGGTIAGGTIKSTAGTVTLNGGTLSGVTYDGALDLSGSSVSVHLANGTAVKNAAGTGAGTINDTGINSNLYFDNTQTFDNVTISLGNALGYTSFLYENDTTSAGAVLTLGSKVTINESGYAQIYTGSYSGDGIVNQGIISQTASGSYLTIYGNSFTNSGTITAGSSGGYLTIDPTTFANKGAINISNGDNVTIEPTNFSNAATGVIAVGAGSTLNLTPGGSWSNLGSITLASGSSLYLGGSFTVAGLGKLTNSGGTVYIQGTLDNTGGTLKGTSALGQAVLYAGTVHGGTVTPAGLALSTSGGTLDAVTYDGALDLSGSSVSVHLANGTAVKNAAGTGAGTINDTGINSGLYFDNTQTFNNATINLGNASGNTSFLYEYDSSGAETVLTLGSKVTINESGYAQIYTGSYSGDGIVNQGIISQTASGSYLTIYGNSFANSGTITAGSNGGYLTIDPTTFANKGAINISNGDNVTIEPTNFSNAATGVIAVGAGSTLNLTPGGSWSNLGSITLASGSSLYLGGSFTVAGLGKLTNSGGTVYIQGTLDNTGGTLKGTSALGQAVLYAGTVHGGTVTPAGLALSTSGGTLDAVTYDGALDLSGSSVSVHLANGTAVKNAAGTGAGTINDTGINSGLYFDNTQTFNNATINLGNASGNTSFLYEYDSSGAETVLTLGSKVTINESGYAQIYTGSYSGDGIVNQGIISQTASGANLSIQGNSFTNSGTIAAASSGGALTIAATTFANSGTIDVANGEQVTIEPTTFTNLSAHTLTGGTYEAEAGSTLQIVSANTITTDNANIILSGAGSTFETYNPSTGVNSAVDTTLTKIGSTGKLQLLAGRNWTTANAAIVNSGLIQLGGGTLKSTGSSASLTDAAGSTLRGSGTVTVTTFTNSGTIEAAGGTLTLTNAVKGTGSLKIDAGATMVLVATAATTNAATFNGAGATLTLDHVGDLSGAIGGIGLDDIFHLVGVTANGASVNGSDQLVVTENGTTVDTLQLSGNNSGFFFLTQAVSGGTDIISLPIPATVADYLDVVSLYDQIPGGFKISDTAANISASLNSLNDSKINSITISDNGAIGVNVTQLTSDSKAIGKLANANASPYQLAVTDSLPNLVGDLSALNGNSHVASLNATSGAGTLSGGATVAAPAFTLTGSTTALTLAEILTYSGSFSAGSGSTVGISSGDALTLTGKDAFSSATISGAGTLNANGTTTAAGLSIGGTATLSDAGTLTESGGSATLGDAAGDVAKLTIAAAGTWDILDNSGIARGKSTASAITNHGLLEKTGGSGTSVITPKVTNDGTVLVSSGTVELKGAVTGTGTDTISGAATLEFDAGVSTAATLGAQNIGFSTGGGTLDLLAPTSFYGEVSNFASGDTVELLGSWAFSAISQAGGVTTLTLASNGTTHGFEFVGAYSQSNFSITSGTTTAIKYA